MKTTTSEELLRQAVANGTISAADLQGFGRMDYAGVARVMKLDAGLREAVVAVKLQEIDGAALLAMRPAEFVSILSLSKPQQCERLEGFLSAIERVAKDPTGTALQEERAVTVTEPTAVAGSKKKRAANDAGLNPDAATIRKKKSAVPRGLQAPRVSGLQRPPPATSAPIPPAAGDAVAPSSVKTATAVPLISAKVQRQPADTSRLQVEDLNISRAAALKNLPKHKVSKDKNPSKHKKQRGVHRQRDPDQQQIQQQLDTAHQGNTRRHLKEKLTAWASSVMTIKSRFDEEVKRQLVNRSKRAVFSTTGFAEGSGVQVELPELIRRLGPIDGIPATFEWKPQAPERITHLICSKDLVRPTVKLYFALASGALILTENFLKEAKSKRIWPDPRQFQRADFPPFEERQQSRWLLRGLPIRVDGPYRVAALSKQQLQALVSALGGTLADESSGSLWLLEDAEALRRRQARGLWGFDEKKGVRKPVPTSAQWLLDCILSWHCKPFEQHKLSIASQPQDVSGEHSKATMQYLPRKEKSVTKKAIRVSGGKKTLYSHNKSQALADSRPPVKQRKPEESGTNKRRPSEGTDPALHCEFPSAVEATSDNTLADQRQSQGRLPHEQHPQNGASLPSGAMRRCRLSKATKRNTGKGSTHAEEDPCERSLPESEERAQAEATGDGSDDVQIDGAQQGKDSGIEALPAQPQKAANGAEVCVDGCDGVSVKDDLPSTSGTSNGVVAQPAERDGSLSRESGPAVTEVSGSRTAVSRIQTASGNVAAPGRELPRVVQSAATRGFIQSPVGQLEVAGLFEANDEEGDSGYDFDFGEHSSQAHKSLGVCSKENPSNTQVESLQGLHIDENVPCSNSSTS